MQKAAQDRLGLTIRNTSECTSWESTDQLQTVLIIQISQR